jgi:hypothetical protein
LEINCPAAGNVAFGPDEFCFPGRHAGHGPQCSVFIAFQRSLELRIGCWMEKRKIYHIICALSDQGERAVHRFGDLSYLSQFFPLSIQNIDMHPMHSKFRRIINKMH